MYRHQFGEFVCRYWGLKGRQLVGGNWGEALCKRTQHCWLLHVASVCTALPTLLGPRTLIMHCLQRLMGSILPMMHCRSQHCWELLHPYTTANTHATTPNIFGATMLGVFASVWAQPDIGSLYVSGKLPTYPSPKPKLTLTSHLVQNVGLEEG